MRSLALCLLLAACPKSSPSSSTSSSADAAPSSSHGDVTWSHGEWAYAEMNGGHDVVEFDPEPGGRKGSVREHRYNCQGDDCWDAGTFEATPTTVSVTSKTWHGERFDVRTAAEIMEWTQNGIVMARLTVSHPPKPLPPVEPYPPVSETPPKGMACDDMNFEQCLLADHCVLEPPPKGGGVYVCREAVGPCEGGATLMDPDFKAKCQAKAGCVYAEAECFCPSETKVPSKAGLNKPLCTCGDGPPERCEKAK